MQHKKTGMSGISVWETAKLNYNIVALQNKYGLN